MESKGKPHGHILRKGQIIVVIISALCLHHFRLDFCSTENTSCYNVQRKGI